LLYSAAMKLETMKLDDMTCDAANVRLHSDKNISAIKKSLKRFGQQHPIIVDAEGVIRAGNGRYAAMRELGWKECNVVRTNLKDREATAFAIADNRTAELAGWDLDALDLALQDLAKHEIDLEAIGFTEGDIVQLLGAANYEPFQGASPDESQQLQYAEKIVIAVTDMPTRSKITIAIKALLEKEGWASVASIVGKG